MRIAHDEERHTSGSQDDVLAASNIVVVGPLRLHSLQQLIEQIAALFGAEWRQGVVVDESGVRPIGEGNAEDV